ncbi:uncharacterized protein BDZ99DRAFT_124590 [Mytilinidion resinicola]|uniref:Uncharacterized protein n=1 Tax=Mytilinidion resinicola TaxID=574789 RepID=A0A6A6Z6F8_9PEZI|nr:uncharacterized protein BDZ99DRAFT_124590 [Mytilinidion resinicola]KAF2815847.1 hypothetical protein BDZ99DRAFT_124590 [Mytilinidion resinicola]
MSWAKVHETEAAGQSGYPEPINDRNRVMPETKALCTTTQAIQTSNGLTASRLTASQLPGAGDQVDKLGGFAAGLQAGGRRSIHNGMLRSRLRLKAKKNETEERQRRARVHHDSTVNGNPRATWLIEFYFGRVGWHSTSVSKGPRVEEQVSTPSTV